MRNSNCKIIFDEENGFTRYGKPSAHKEERLNESFYHEAAYDAYMTGVLFAQTIRFCEKRDQKGSKGKNKKKEEQKLEEEEEKKADPRVSSQQIAYNKGLAQEFQNTISASSGMFIPLDPNSAVVERNFSKVLWLDLQERSHELTAKQIAERLAPYGDFTVLKDKRTSAFIEILYIGLAEPNMEEFVQKAN